MRPQIRTLALIALCFLFPSPLSAVSFLKYFTFSEDEVLKIWKEKLYKGRVEYKLVTEGNEKFIQSHSKKTASGMYYEFPKKLRYNPTSKPYISWRWKVNRFPKKDPSELLEDFGARIYIIFPSNIFIFSNCIAYVWDDTIPAGTVKKSSFTSRIQMIFLRKGKTQDWVHEEVNIVEDYMRVFGETEVDDEIGAIAFMTDSEETESEASALFDDIKIGYSTPLLKKK